MKTETNTCKRKHRSREDQENPEKARTKTPFAKYAEAFGIAYGRGIMKKRR